MRAREHLARRLHRDLVGALVDRVDVGAEPELDARVDQPGRERVGHLAEVDDAGRRHAQRGDAPHIGLDRAQAIDVEALRLHAVGVARSSSCARRGSSRGSTATITLPQRSNGTPCSVQNRSIARRPATALFAFSDPGR